jgi:putative transcriptional regulator
MKIFEIKYNNIKPKIGSLLLSEPFQAEQIFNRSVIILCEYNEEGSFGVVLNKPSPYKVKDIIKEMSEVDFPVYIGGPVDVERIFFIHDQGDIIPNSIKINEKYYWGGDLDVIKNMIANKQLGSENIRFFIGYSGWDAEQLKEELTYNSWVVLNKEIDNMLSFSAESLWEKCVNKLGKDYSFWTKMPEDPILN